MTIGLSSGILQAVVLLNVFHNLSIKGVTGFKFMIKEALRIKEKEMLFHPRHKVVDTVGPGAFI